ncbi:MAG: recombinase RecQ [Gemmatimonadetes bacterium]|nr:MAG: recombinase RecQ [Gemmatimonadota bacterium]
MPTFNGGLEAARTILEQRFGHARFRIHQLKVLGPLLAGRNVLAVLPTSAGKSLCYQLPALMRADLTVVVSPLVALMQDQVDGLRARGAGDKVALVNGQQSGEDNRAAIGRAAAGELANTHVSLLAIDEAHCITEWGNEFRPVYRRLGMFRSLLGRPPTIALTGSATPAARADILHVLRMPDAEVVVTSFDRPNLTFTARRVRDDRERFALIRERVRDAPGASLIYTPTRRLTELVARALLRTSVRAAPYHAGLAANTRRQVLRAFLADRVHIIVATSAFGMGIDKPDVRQVLHWGPPPTLEAYYQEAGRAGRDGKQSECLILWRPEDLAWGNIAPPMRRYVAARRNHREMMLQHFGEV